MSDRDRFGVNFVTGNDKEICFFCKEALIPIKVQVYYENPKSKDVLLLDITCFQHLTALCIKAMIELSPQNLDVQ